MGTSILAQHGNGIGGTKVGCFSSSFVHPSTHFIDISVYQRVGSRTISVVALLSGEPAIYTTSPEVARQIVSTRGTTEKAPDSTIFLAYVS